MTLSAVAEPEPVEERPPRPEDQMLYIVEVGAVVATVWLKGESSMIESKMMTKGHFFGVRNQGVPTFAGACSSSWP